MQITLYSEQNNNERVRVMYSPITECVTCNSCYINTKTRSTYYQKNKEKINAKREQYFRKYYQNNKTKIKRQWQKYRQTTKGKLAAIRHVTKRNRNLGFIPLMSNPFPNETPVEYHHINDIFVIPVPRQVHQSMLGKNHRIKVNDWIEQYIGNIGVC